jgi:hypothetical protein
MKLGTGPDRELQHSCSLFRFRNDSLLKNVIGPANNQKIKEKLFWCASEVLSNKNLSYLQTGKW